MVKREVLEKCYYTEHGSLQYRYQYYIDPMATDPFTNHIPHGLFETYDYDGGPNSKGFYKHYEPKGLWLENIIVWE